MPFIDDSTQILKSAGHKITGPRVAVLQVLAEAEIPLSAHDIEERIPANIPINVVTIYRVIELLEQLGITHRIHTKEGYVRCDFEQAQGCHSFAVCHQCGRTDEFVQKKCAAENSLPKNLSYKSLSHLSELAGLCHRCQ